VGTTQPGAALEVTGGAIVNGVTAGVEGISSTSDPGRMAYPDAYETIGVSRPEYNLRLQSPNAVIVHTYDPGSGGYAPRLAVAGDRVTVGPGANGRLWSRHIDGKHFASDTNDGLFLNWDTGQPVHVGGGAAADLWVHGSFHWDGDQSGANYVRLGLMQLCWGEGSFGAVSGEYRIPVSFPVPFAGNPAVTASLDDPGYGKATCEGGLGAWQVNPSGFILLYKYNQSRTQTIYYSWIAVGRWA
jgi:hypothetical protein